MAQALEDKYRPKNFQQVVGHDTVVKMLRSKKDWKSIMFSGAAGTGKTSLARVVAMWENCLQPDADIGPCGVCSNCTAILRGCHDYREENIGDSSGKDTLRTMLEWLRIKPIELKRKVLVLDEAQNLTVAAQQLLLKPLEEPPSYVTIILCTTNPDKLVSTILQRCTKFRLDSLPEMTLLDLMVKVVEAEQKEELITSETAAKLIELSDGSPRQLLKNMDDVFAGAVLGTVDASEEVFKDLINAVLAGQTLVAINLYTTLKEKFASEEMLRRILGYYQAMLRNVKNKDKAIQLYTVMEKMLEVQQYYAIDKDGKVLLAIVGSSIAAEAILNKRQTDDD